MMRKKTHTRLPFYKEGGVLKKKFGKQGSLPKLSAKRNGDIGRTDKSPVAMILIPPNEFGELCTNLKYEASNMLISSTGSSPFCFFVSCQRSFPGTRFQDQRRQCASSNVDGWPSTTLEVRDIVDWPTQQRVRLLVVK